MFNCTVCDKVFNGKCSLTRYIETYDREEFACSVCPKVCTRREKLVNQIKTMSGKIDNNLIISS